MCKNTKRLIVMVITIALAITMLQTAAAAPGVSPDVLCVSPAAKSESPAVFSESPAAKSESPAAKSESTDTQSVSPAALLRDAAQPAPGVFGEAEELGLLPDSIKDADPKKPITRGEFAELVLLMCETYTGEEITPMGNYRFTDTDDPKILKAYFLGLVNAADIAERLFSPDDLIDRETMAVMYYNAIKLLAPLADYFVSAGPVIPDLQDISEFAADSVKYLYSKQILVGGTSGYFMPRPITEAQKAANYGMATREQAVIVALRIFKALPEIVETRFLKENMAAEMMNYAKEEPQGGVEIGRDELVAILFPISLRVRLANNMSALSFTGDYIKTAGEEWRWGYDSFYMYNTWSAHGDSQYKYDEQQVLRGAIAGYTRYSLSSFDADIGRLSSYLWDSKSDVGEKNTVALQSYSLFDFYSLTAYIPKVNSGVLKIFDDEVINGQLCKVFSETILKSTIQGDTPPGSGFGPPPEDYREETTYFYISTVTGLCTMKRSYDTLRNETYQMVEIIFTITPSLTDAKKITPPANIEF